MIVKILGSLLQNVILAFDELSAMAFEQSSSKPGLQGLTYGQITMYDDYIGVQAPQVLQTPTATTTTADTAPTPTNSSSQATNFPNTSQDVDELETQQQVQHQPATIADNVPNAMFDENTFVNPFATPFTSDAESIILTICGSIEHAYILPTVTDIAQEKGQKKDKTGHEIGKIMKKQSRRRTHLILK
ncbi:hypothetical protein Tco_0118612 [Tanacetum coccineum]